MNINSALKHLPLVVEHKLAIPSRAKIQPPEMEYVNFPCETQNPVLPPEISERISDLANEKAFAAVSRFGYLAYQKKAEFLEKAFDQGRYDELIRPHVVYGSQPKSLLGKLRHKIFKLNKEVESPLKSNLASETHTQMMQTIYPGYKRQIIQLHTAFCYILEQSFACMNEWSTEDLEQSNIYDELALCMANYLMAFKNNLRCPEKIKGRLVYLFPKFFAKILCALPEPVPMLDASIEANKLTIKMLTASLLALWEMQRPDLVRFLHTNVPFNPVSDQNQEEHDRKVMDFIAPFGPFLPSIQNVPDVVRQFANSEYLNKKSIETTLEVIKCFLSPHAQIILNEVKTFHHLRVSDVLLVEFLTHPKNIQDYGFSYTTEANLLDIASMHGLTENVSLLLTQRNFTFSQIYDALKCAAKFGHVEIVKMILSRFPEQFDSTVIKTVLKEALLYQQPEVCFLLLADPRLEHPLDILCKYEGQSQTIQQLLADPALKDTVDLEELFKKALDHDAFDVVELFVKEISDPIPYLEYLIKQGEVSLARLIMNNRFVYVAQNDDRLLRLACRHNHQAMIEWLREEYQKQDPGKDFKALVAGMQRTSDFRCDSLEEKLAALKRSCKSGFLTVVEGLLKDEEVAAKRAEFTDYGGGQMAVDVAHDLLLPAVRFGHYEVVRLLIANAKPFVAQVGENLTDDQILYNEQIVNYAFEALKIACINGNKNMVDVLLQSDFWYTIYDNDYNLLKFILRFDFFDILKTLLDSTHVKIHDQPLVYMILWALKEERRDMIYLLLDHEKTKQWILTYFNYHSCEEMLEKDARFAFLRHGNKRFAELPAEETSAAKHPKLFIQP